MEKIIASTNSRAKLSEQDIHNICIEFAKGVELRNQASQYTYKALAKKYGVTKNQIFNLLKGHSYKHVERPRTVHLEVN